MRSGCALMISVPVAALSNSGVPGEAVAYCLKYRIGLSVIVTSEGVGRAVAEIRREGLPGEILIDLPAHAGGLQHFGKGLPQTKYDR